MPVSNDFIKRLDFKSEAGLVKSIRDLHLTDKQVVPMLTSVNKSAPAQTVKVARVLVAPEVNFRKEAPQIRQLVKWGSSGGAPSRRVVAQAFCQAGTELALVHQISQLARAEARGFMKEFLAVGGTLKPVAQWLQIAGQALRRRRKASGTDGLWDDIVGAVEDAFDTVVEGVTSVVDSVLSAGKSLVDMVGQIVGWTVDQVSDVVEALIEGGKKIADILSAAIKKGTAALVKFVQAIVKAGKSAADVLAWAAGQAAATVKSVVNALIQAGRTVTSVVTDAIAKGAAVVKKAVLALVQLGKQIGDILRAAVNKTAAVVRQVVEALLAAGAALSRVLVATVGQAISLARNVVLSLVQMGKSIAAILQAVAAEAISVVRNVVDGLLYAGKTLAQVVTTAVSYGVTLVRHVASALVQVGRRAADVLNALVNQAAAVFQAAVRGLLEAGRTVANVLADVYATTAKLIKKTVQALYQIGKTVEEILVTVVRRAAGIVQTVLEALLTIGVRLAVAVATIVTDIVESFRDDFFRGLLALGKAPLDILKAALEAGGAILALSVAVFMEIWGGHRPLTDAERAEARKVFGWSIDLDRVKIAVASIPADVVNWLNGNRTFTTMYVINFASWDTVDTPTLIHELTHVWQGVVAGPIYMVEALHAQIFGEGYDYTDQDLIDAGGNFNAFNREQQASIIEHYWVKRYGPSPSDYSLYLPYARAVYRAQPATIHLGPISVPIPVLSGRPN